MQEDESTNDVHAPQSGKCAFGYELVNGSTRNYGSCENSVEFGYCILPPALASKRCEEDAACDGVSETSNGVWLMNYPGMQMLGRTPLKNDIAWKTCKKTAAGRTWDHLVNSAAASLLQQESKRRGRSGAGATQKAAAQKQRRAVDVAGLGLAPSLARH